MALCSPVVLFILGIAVASIYILLQIVQAPRQPRKTFSDEKRHEASDDKLAITAISGFDWETTEPLKFRPFKPIYYITMALRSSTPSDLIVIDSNYLSRIHLRKGIMEAHPDHVFGRIPSGLSAVQEVYSYLLGDYLPTRYPSMFSRDEKIFRNHVTNASFPLQPPEDPLAEFRILGETVEDDMFLLDHTPDGHRCIAFLCCFPSGFDPAEKLGNVLKDIHGPVPAYDKIGPSMERYFGKLEVGKSANRVNWSVTTNPELFNLATNHVKEDENVGYDVDVDVAKTYVRVELQTLTRLPRTRAILFSFKTFLYPIVDIKAEGLGPELADAIEGLKLGNAKGMWTYKGGVRWGKSVCEYLRS